MVDGSSVIDLGDDPGRQTFRIGGVDLNVDVYVELEALNKAAVSAGADRGTPFLDAIAKDVESRHGVKMSAALAHAFYKAVLKREGEVADFLSQRLASLGLLDSTPAEGDGSVQGDSGPISPV